MLIEKAVAFMKSFNQNNGAALIFAIFVILVLTIITGILAGALNNEVKLRLTTEERAVAKYLAEAGIEHGMFEIVTHPDYFSDPGAINGLTRTSQVHHDHTAIGTYQVEITFANDRFSIVSTGTTNPGPGIRVKIMKIMAVMDYSGAIVEWKEIYD
jgi:Tfp pilus assembly protein PilX